MGRQNSSRETHRKHQLVVAEQLADPRSQLHRACQRGRDVKMTGEDARAELKIESDMMVVDDKLELSSPSVTMGGSCLLSARSDWLARDWSLRRSPRSLSNPSSGSC